MFSVEVKLGVVIGPLHVICPLLVVVGVDVKKLEADMLALLIWTVSGILRCHFISETTISSLYFVFDIWG